jgi:hypothetical protein
MWPYCLFCLFNYLISMLIKCMWTRIKPSLVHFGLICFVGFVVSQSCWLVPVFGGYAVILLTCSSIWRLCRDIVDLFQYLEVMPWYCWLVPVFGGYAVILLTCSSIWRLCRDIVDLLLFVFILLLKMTV